MPRTRTRPPLKRKRVVPYKTKTPYARKWVLPRAIPRWRDISYATPRNPDTSIVVRLASPYVLITVPPSTPSQFFSTTRLMDLRGYTDYAQLFSWYKILKIGRMFVLDTIPESVGATYSGTYNSGTGVISLAEQPRHRVLLHTMTPPAYATPASTVEQFRSAQDYTVETICPHPKPILYVWSSPKVVNELTESSSASAEVPEANKGYPCTQYAVPHWGKTMILENRDAYASWNAESYLVAIVRFYGKKDYTAVS